MTDAAMLQTKLKRNERYKYVDLAQLDAIHFPAAVKVADDKLHDAIATYRLQHPDVVLIVLVNGFFSSALSDSEFPEGLIVQSMIGAEHDLKKYNVSAENYPLASHNSICFKDGVSIQARQGYQQQAPIHVLSIAVGNQKFCANTQNHILVENNVKLTVFYEYVSDTTEMYLMNDVDYISLSDASEIHITKLQRESKQAKRIAHTFIQQGINSRAVYNCFSIGGAFYRDDIVADLLQSGAECQTGGFYRLSDDQFVDHHIDVNHSAAHTNSDMTYKGVLDKKSRAVFNGRLHVEQDAQKIVAHQANHNVLLSKQAEVYSKPELEIYADDVKCKHGATTGQIDQDALFYLRARGIKEEAAMKILLAGFAEELIDNVESELVREYIKQMVIA